MSRGWGQTPLPDAYLMMQQLAMTKRKHVQGGQWFSQALSPGRPAAAAWAVTDIAYPSAFQD
jgi:Mg-chelatase subunit ChlD